MENHYAIVLAAGQGTRMKSKLYKVLHPVCGKPMVEHVVEQVKALDFGEIVTVVGHGAETVESHLNGKSLFVKQEEQLGTAHAVMQAAPLLEGKEGITLVLCGDTPLLTSETLAELVTYHKDKKAMATILTAEAQNPMGYGRIVRNDLGIVEKIVEQKDASEKIQTITEINTGTFCFDNKALFAALNKVTNENAQAEFYLTDVIGILREQNDVVAAYRMHDFSESLGVNDRVALAQAQQLMKQRINETHMRQGVTIVDPLNTYIESDVIIAADTVIEPGVRLKGNTIIGSDCIISGDTEIVDSTIGNKVTVRSSAIEESNISDGVQVGPYAHIRPNSNIASQVKIGNFVEVKNATIDEGSKIPHLSYVGDATVGHDVNIGCGSITVNYDGTNKHHTAIGNNVFVGCNSNLVAPVTIASNTFIAAGSTITKNVPEHALAVARARQTNKEGYAEKFGFSKK
ncbi:bifunctional UDP-N-acetylglucosamine diphosphorylase/glucosamine-1-phosphate N-acetyltransferase GlmU [Brochothrix campestris]|uniref:Bifunctional protein GlmU n=1 Tax=Brochothrix campestris FSL F6-1037 TaxID=1265861 RepID=W7C9B9_9LIST|nr:bifunctional UDP-N-acetylglucosamine diphosphorylase/glucosamine-1-phosphate N-acetyltransferase GlmU [Brochothrix campestris]EUJ36059.1 bifunctional N-acetylglucosamine-1-phosphate uridyltransferase/glucosamine-1-phosphate acetyltransferase [Brochothrix campestris FSL F6-1037]